MELSLLNLLAVFVAALAGGMLARRLGYPSVLGELLAGILLGPPLLGLIDGSEALAVLGEVGILLMMLYIGMEIEPGELKKASKGGLLAAFGGFITPFLFCYGLLVFAGAGQMAAVFVGVAAGVTSLATKSRILAELDLFDTRLAHVMMAGALVADTVSIVIFAALLGVAEAGHIDLLGVGLVAGKAVLFFAGAALVGVYLLPRILARSGLLDRLDSGGRFIAVIGIGLLFAEAAHLAGLHGILGAFLAGLFLRGAKLGRVREGEIIGQVRTASLGFLAPIFFVTAGFSVSLDVLTSSTGLLVAVIVLATVGKILGTALFYLPTGHGWREGLTIGAGMNGRGAVEIIIAQIGLSMGVINAEVFSILVFMAIATTATVPVLLRWGVDWLDRRNELARVRDPKSGVVIVGAGPLGRRLAAELGSNGRVTLVDNNRLHCRIASAEGLTALCGSALNDDVLEEAGAAQASHLVALTENPDVNAVVAHVARNTFHVPEVLLATRSSDEQHRHLTDGLGVGTAFGQAIELETWEHWLEQDGVSLVEIELGDDLAAPLRTEPTLTLSIERDGERLPFTAGIDLRPGDRLRQLRRAPV